MSLSSRSSRAWAERPSLAVIRQLIAAEVGVLSYLDDRETTSATGNPSLLLGAVVRALLPPVTGTRGSGSGARQSAGDPGGTDLTWLPTIPLRLALPAAA